MARSDPTRSVTSPSLHRDCRALVLAGGRSRRFGSDKLDQSIDGSKVLDRVVRAVRVVTDDITVVGRTHPGCRSLSDPEPRHGPLSAISHALGTLPDGDALRASGPAGSVSYPGYGVDPSDLSSRSPVGEAVVVVGGDHPLVRPSVLALVVDSLGEHEAAVPLDHEGRAQPLVAVYRSSLGPQMRSAVDDGRYGLIRFLETVDVDWIEPARWESVDPEGHSFMDIDTVEDLQQVDAVGRSD